MMETSSIFLSNCWQIMVTIEVAQAQEHFVIEFFIEGDVFNNHITMSVSYKVATFPLGNLQLALDLEEVIMILLQHEVSISFLEPGKQFPSLNFGVSSIERTFHLNKTSITDYSIRRGGQEWVSHIYEDSTLGYCLSYKVEMKNLVFLVGLQSYHKIVTLCQITTYSI